MAKQCPSSQKSKKCRGSHHSLLHKDWTKKPSMYGQFSQSSETREDPNVLTMHTSELGHQQQVLVMTCQVIVVGPDGNSYKARALLDSGSSASFILKWVAQHLCLPRRRQDSKMNGIGGGTVHLLGVGIAKDYVQHTIMFSGNQPGLETFVQSRISQSWIWSTRQRGHPPQNRWVFTHGASRGGLALQDHHWL